MKLRLLTWGHGRSRSFADLIVALSGNLREPGPTGIVDIRRSRETRNPYWRGTETRRPQWANEEPWGRSYYYLRGLGNAEGAWRGEWVPCRGDELADTQLNVAVKALVRLGALVLICSEADPHRGKCHRVIVAEHIAGGARAMGHDVDVVHV